MKACPRCGQTISPGTRQCGQCGFDLVWEQGFLSTARLSLDQIAPGVVTQIDLLRRATIGEFEIVTELGRGGMATVFLAHDLKHDRPVALKVLLPELAATVGPERFEREIKLAARLQHPHILTVLDSGEANGLLWFTMPYVEGESLRTCQNHSTNCARTDDPPVSSAAVN